MKKTAGLLALLLVSFMLSACGAPADQPAKNWIAFLDKHKPLLANEKFDAAAFKAEGQPLVAELKKHSDASTGKILMTEPVLAEWQRANKEFGEACDVRSEKTGDMAATTAFVELVSDLIK
jgi:hypothetical protein